MAFLQRACGSSSSGGGGGDSSSSDGSNGSSGSSGGGCGGGTLVELRLTCHMWGQPCGVISPALLTQLAKLYRRLASLSIGSIGIGRDVLESGAAAAAAVPAACLARGGCPA
jgi:hypothetical protein